MASENSGAPHLPPSWPEAPRADVPTSWPELPPQDPPAWQGPPRQDPPGWPDAPRQDPLPAWSDAQSTQISQIPAWPNAQPQQQAQPSHGNAWPETPPQQSHGNAWPEAQPSHGNAYPEAQPSPGNAWSNLSTPAPWPPKADPLDTSTPWPPQPQVQPQGDPLERTVTYNQAPQAPVHQPPAHQPPAGPPQEPTPAQHQDAPRPGSNLVRDPSDPDRPFVTAGQISGSRTPPPERQQELWNTVFGDNYDSMGDDSPLDHDDEPGKPVWIYALAGSVAIALVAGLVWAFWAGPLASEDPPKSSPIAGAPSGKPSGKASTTPPKRTTPRLPKYSGPASPVTGVVTDQSAGITVPRLGGRWLVDQRGSLIRSTYGFTTRQFVKIGTDALGNPISAQIMTGPLGPTLTKWYTSPDELEPVIKAVVVNARKKLFPEGNTVKKTAQQKVKVGDLPAELIAYEVTAGEAKTTLVVAAVATGNEVPSIVYMSVPGTGKSLLPDVNTVFKSIKSTTQG